MNLVLISPIYPPEPVVSSRTTADLATELTARGHAVTVITAFPNRPGGRIFEGYRRRMVQIESDRGTTVVRVPATISRRSTLLSRFLENVSFGLSSAIRLLRTPKVDAVYVNSWPVFAVWMVAAACRLRRIPFVLSVQDLYPESLATQKRFASTSFTYRLLRYIDSWSAHRARSLAVISPRFAQAYASRGIDPSNIHVIPNWGDGSRVKPEPDRGRALREKLGFPPTAFVAGYAGNIGRAAGIEMLLDAIRALAAETNIFFIIAGDGSELSLCHELKQQLAEEAHRLQIIPRFPVSQSSEILSACDVLLAPTAEGQASVSVPSKLIDYYFSARPVIAAALPDSDLHDAVVDAGAGWVIPPGDSAALAARLRSASTKREMLSEYGDRARRYADQNFNGATSRARLADLLEA